MIGTFLSSESRIESSHRVGLIAQTRPCGPTDECRGALSSVPLTKGLTRKDGECQRLREINYRLLESIIRLAVSDFSGPLIRLPCFPSLTSFCVARLRQAATIDQAVRFSLHRSQEEVTYKYFSGLVCLSHQGG